MKNRLIVLNYHQVPEHIDPLLPGSIDRDIFRQQMGMLKRYFKVIDLEQALVALAQDNLPSRAVALTFDDGYRDNYDIALPELKEMQLPATFFIATDYLDGGRMWNDTIIETIRYSPKQALDLAEFGLPSVKLTSSEQRAAAIQVILPHFKYMEYQQRLKAVDRLAQISGADLPDNLMMTSEQVQEMHRAGMTIGGHTASHPILRKLSAQEAIDDIRQGREVLQSLTGIAPRLFAYPNGKPGQDYDSTHVGLVEQAGFDAAFSTQWGYVSRSMNPFELPRVGFGTHIGWRFALRGLKSFFEAPVAFASTLERSGNSV